MSLVLDGFRQSARVFGMDVQRVRAACFAVAAHEDVGVGGEEKDLDVRQRAQVVNFFRQGGEVGSVTRVHGDGDRLRLFTGEVAHEAVKQCAWQVVYAVVAEVFEGIESDGFARPGQSGDDEHFGGLFW